MANDKCEDCGTVIDGSKHVVAWPLRHEGPYLMCENCASHSVKKRSAVLYENISVFAEFENGTLVKIVGSRPQYMDGYSMIMYIKILAMMLKHNLQQVK